MKKLLTLLLLIVVISSSAIAQQYLLHGKSMQQVKIELKKEGLTESDFNTGVLETEETNVLYYLTFYHARNEARVTYVFEDDICMVVTIARDYNLLNETIGSLNESAVKEGEYWYNHRQFATYKYEIVRGDTYFFMVITIVKIHE